MVPACLHEVPFPRTGNCDILDYAALFPSTLLEYARASGNWETAHDLWPVARRQIEGVLAYVDERSAFVNPGTWWIFIDWRDGRDKSAAMHGVLLCALRDTLELASELGEKEPIPAWQETLGALHWAARAVFWDDETRFFLSGADGQISWASQIWMILGGAVSPDEGADVLRRLRDCPAALTPAGPYLYHYAVEAIIACGMSAEAAALLRDYWGGMLDRGATTFWEVFDPHDAALSPYGNPLLNSHCHAWSCTPTYFIRTYADLFA